MALKIKKLMNKLTELDIEANLANRLIERYKHKDFFRRLGLYIFRVFFTVFIVIFPFSTMAIVYYLFFSYNTLIMNDLYFTFYILLGFITGLIIMSVRQGIVVSKLNQMTKEEANDFLVAYIESPTQLRFLTKDLNDTMIKKSIKPDLRKVSIDKFVRTDVIRKVVFVFFRVFIFFLVLALLPGAMIPYMLNAAMFQFFLDSVAFNIIGICICVLILCIQVIIIKFKLKKMNYSQAVDYLTLYVYGRLPETDDLTSEESEEKKTEELDSVEDKKSVSRLARKIFAKKEAKVEVVEKGKEHEEIIITDKYKKIRDRSEELLALMKRFPCSNNNLEDIRITDEYDKQAGCKGPAVYVCHHCKTSLCSTHSYWIPDKEFPYYSIPGVKRRIEDKTIAMKKEGISQMVRSILLFIIAIIISTTINFMGEMAAVISAILLIFGGVYFIKGIKNIETSKFKPIITNPHPEFIDSYKTKWGNFIEKSYAFLGYYTAVHCWKCLGENHPEFLEVAKSISNIVFLEAQSWSKQTEFQFVPYSPSDCTKAANFAANLYLNDFKFANVCLFPKGGKIEILERPPNYSKQIPIGTIQNVRFYPPTPVWNYRPVIEKPRIDEVLIDNKVKRFSLILSIAFFVTTMILTLVYGIMGGTNGLTIFFAILFLLAGSGVILLLVKFMKTKIPEEVDETSLYLWFDKYRLYIKTKMNSK